MVKRLKNLMVMAVVLGIALGSVTGCASEGRHDSTRPSSEVRRDSDRFFEKMKEEERARGDGAERRP